MKRSPNLPGVKLCGKPYIVSVKPPSSHVDELQSVVSAHDLSITQNIQLWKNQETWWNIKRKMKENANSDDEEGWRCWTNENGPLYLVGARQLEFQTQKLLDGAHSNPAGAADEPLHQILDKQVEFTHFNQLMPTSSFPLNLNRWPVKTHRDAALAWRARVAQTVQADGDLRVAAVVVFVSPVVTVIIVSPNAPDVRRHKLVASQTFCKEKCRDRLEDEPFQKCANTNAVC